MSLQTRLESLVSAVGADIKFLRGRIFASTGATQATRWVGATTGGAPTTGAHLVGDWVITTTGQVFVCTAAGTPGTWIENAVGGTGGSAAANMATTDTVQTISGGKTFTGLLRANGSVDELPQGYSRLDFGVQNGSPRLIFENPTAGAGANSRVWEIDNDYGNFRWFVPNEVVKMTLNPTGDLTTFGKVTSGTTGLWDGANRAYSDSNPPETLNMTEYTAAVPTPPSGQATLYTTDGTSLRMKNDAGNDWLVGPSAGGAAGTNYLKATDYGWSDTATAAVNDSAIAQAIAAARLYARPVYIGIGKEADIPISVPIDLKATSTFKNGVEIFGDGGRTRVRQMTNTAEILQVGGFGNYLHDFSIRRGAYGVSEVVDANTADGLVFYKCAYSYFERLGIDNNANGISIAQVNVLDPGSTTGTANWMFSCTFDNVFVNRYTKSGLFLNSYNGGRSTGSVWTNTYVQNKISTGGAATSTGSPVDIFQCDDMVFNQLNIEDHANIGNGLIVVSSGQIVVNGLHFERTALGGSWYPSLVRVYGSAGLIVNGMTVTLSDMAPAGVANGATRLMSIAEGAQLEVRGLSLNQITRGRTDQPFTLAEIEGADVPANGQRNYLYVGDYVNLAHTVTPTTFTALSSTPVTKPGFDRVATMSARDFGTAYPTVLTNATAATETVIAQFAVPAGEIKASSFYLARVLGVVSSTATLQYRVRVGTAGTTADPVAVTYSTSTAGAANNQAQIEASIFGTGATTVSASGRAQLANVFVGPSAVAPINVTVSSTAITYITVTVQQSVAQTFTTRVGLLEKLA